MPGYGDIDAYSSKCVVAGVTGVATNKNDTLGSRETGFMSDVLSRVAGIQERILFVESRLAQAVMRVEGPTPTDGSASDPKKTPGMPRGSGNELIARLESLSSYIDRLNYLASKIEAFSC